MIDFLITATVVLVCIFGTVIVVGMFASELLSTDTTIEAKIFCGFSLWIILLFTLKVIGL